MIEVMLFVLSSLSGLALAVILLSFAPEAYEKEWCRTCWEPKEMCRCSRYHIKEAEPESRGWYNDRYRLV